MVKLFDKLFGSTETKVAKRFIHQIQEINRFEDGLGQLSDADLCNKTNQFRERLVQGINLNDLMNEAFAVVREASKRTLAQRQYDVQLIGGMVLNNGNIAEMKTGEGKTLVATLPAYLNALEGSGVHIVTVNDYLSRRDPVWMGPIYHMLGLSVGCLQHDSAFIYDPSFESGDMSYQFLRPVPRKEAYLADITYGTNNEFGFDYLRDNMVLDLEQMVQRELNYAIVDEVDNILIDEARTPLIISGPAQEPVQLYSTVAQIAPNIQFDLDYVIEDRTKAISLTEDGIAKIERLLKVDNLYAPENFHLVHYVENAVKANVNYKKDKEYVVRNGEVVIVDEFTGRLQPGRRWSDGLHQAVEAKEGLRIQKESVTYATITLQNYFRMYKKLAGMTGTAVTESEEFIKIYNLDVITVPTNVPGIRIDNQDHVYLTAEAKWQAVCDEIKALHFEDKPVLAGTASVESSERLSRHLKELNIVHKVLNAKNHESESLIISAAGRPGAVTVATNMAGRGTDIVLGGNPDDDKDTKGDSWLKAHDDVVGNGGLYVIGTEHHESRRIDNQLRGRSGRQGDPGFTRFYASLEDEVIRRFGGERTKNVMERMSKWTGIDSSAPLESGMITKLIESSQERVEGYHFEMRKHLLEYDNVLNNQREHIYAERQRILAGSDLKELVLSMVVEEIRTLVSFHITGRDRVDWDVKSFFESLKVIFPLPPDMDTEIKISNLSSTEIEERLLMYCEEYYQFREDTIDADDMRLLERLILLRALDLHWVQHLTSIERLRQGISLQAFAQRNPLVAYQREGRRMYDELLSRMRYDVAHSIYTSHINRPSDGKNHRSSSSSPDSRKIDRSTTSVMDIMHRKTEKAFIPAKKMSRNEVCYCGSGKKYKRCHGV
ncbi:MAG: preprotein translocase subunit SecA [Dehalococcoidia bacterium]|nr:preprotein translocase subunit SecA [Dehalococcoidia bacterium]